MTDKKTESIITIWEGDENIIRGESGDFEEQSGGTGMKQHVLEDETKQTCPRAEAPELETQDEAGLLLWLIIPNLSN